jgi:predicted Rdx family selenoprotein
MATEMFAAFGKDLAIQLTPVGQGRYEVYLNGEKIWDKKEAPGKPYPNLGIIHDLTPVVQKALEAVPAEAG